MYGKKYFFVFLQHIINDINKSTNFKFYVYLNYMFKHYLNVLLFLNVTEILNLYLLVGNNFRLM